MVKKHAIYDKLPGKWHVYYLCIRDLTGNLKK
jgi:hypothetical protein